MVPTATKTQPLNVISFSPLWNCFKPIAIRTTCYDRSGVAHYPLTLTCHPYQLEFRYPFRIAHGIRTTTPVVFVQVKENNCIGYGEAALPPYLPENIETVIGFFKKINLKNYSVYNGIAGIMEYVNSARSGNFAAKAAIDIALHDLYGKVNKTTLKKIFHTEHLPSVYSTFTLGMGTKEEMQKKMQEAKNFNIFKIKLGSKNDKKIVEDFLQIMHHCNLHGQKINGWAVDVNQGWNDKIFASDMLCLLHEKGAIWVEQPLPVNMLDEVALLNEKSPVPIIADEAVQTLNDIETIKFAYSGINIKLMKCGGLTEAKKMIERASALNMKILIGCMSESSCAVTAAAHLSSFCDWADLDGPYLIKNDPFEGVKITDGKVTVPDGYGTGAALKNGRMKRISSSLF